MQTAALLCVLLAGARAGSEVQNPQEAVPQLLGPFLLQKATQEAVELPPLNLTPQQIMKKRQAITKALHVIVPPTAAPAMQQTLLPAVIEAATSQAAAQEAQTSAISEASSATAEAPGQLLADQGTTAGTAETAAQASTAAASQQTASSQGTSDAAVNLETAPDQTVAPAAAAAVTAAADQVVPPATPAQETAASPDSLPAAKASTPLKRKAVAPKQP